VSGGIAPADTTASVWIPLAVVVPLAWALLTAAWTPARGAWLVRTGLLVWCAQSAALWWHVRTQGATAYALGGWSEPLGIGLVADGLGATFVLLTAVLTTAVTLYQLAAREPVARLFWPLLFLLGAALDTVWLAADLFNMYVGLELLGLSAVGLVALAGTPIALEAALRYLLAALLGSLAYLLGVALLYAETGVLALAALQPGLSSTGTTITALALITAGLLLKSALVPLHGWLPPAHAAAQPPVSALLSALVVKASFVILLRLLGAPVATALGVLGAAAIGWGGWQALRARELKALVAHSTVAQLGYLFIAVPLLATASELSRAAAWDGLMLQLVAHALAKSAMFLASGTLIVAVGSYRVDALAGVSRHLPLSLFAFGLAAVSLMGLPPSGGFSAKWLLLQAAITSRQWGWLVPLLGGGLLTAGYVFRVFRASFLEGSDDHITATPAAWDVIALALAVAAIVLGLAAVEPLAVLRVGATAPGAS
jgi:formate hydrogenlyase subunit 3/multisubunit Na+/H+ antiporter MnhD subunit